MVFSFVSWALGLGLCKSTSWRVWEFHSDVVPVVFIGLWEAFYFQRLNISGSIFEEPVYVNINGSWDIPDDMVYEQNLILLANVSMLVTLVFSSLGFFVTWVKSPCIDFRQLCYTIAATSLSFSCFFTMVAVSWNFAVDFYGNDTLQFPPNFPVQTKMVKKKRVSYVLPLGITIVSLSAISTIIFFFHMCAAKPLGPLKPTVELTHLKLKI